jgi:uncharacterized protein YccT (UPF0319 family)
LRYPDQERRLAMAKTADGKKFNRVPEYTRVGRDGKTITVKEHIRSNPTTSKGQAKAKN